jgi:hypothetical protein
MMSLKDIEIAKMMAEAWRLNDLRNQKDERHLRIKEERRLAELIRKRIREDDGK